nr:MAG TPA_asm: hypothetical protein [Caudoviricetes sp.]
MTGFLHRHDPPLNSSHEPLQKLMEHKSGQNAAKSDAKDYKTRHKEPKTHVKGMTTV